MENDIITAYMRKDKDSIWWTDVRKNGALLYSTLTPASQIRPVRESCLWKPDDGKEPEVEDYERVQKHRRTKRHTAS